MMSSFPSEQEMVQLCFFCNVLLLASEIDPVGEGMWLEPDQNYNADQMMLRVSSGI